ncbi:MAG: phosphotransferase [Streptosporangiales bacterium]|nr:phosphotransferase [Streptosporangiales bacterium]
MATGDLDTATLRDFLADRRPELADGPLTAELITGGKSNLTYVVTDGSRRWILRRPPLGHVLATAHDMAREYRVLAALAGTAVPVPEVLLLNDDAEPLGAPFYLMSEVRGTVYRSAAETDQLGAERARALSFQLVDVLADLHVIDPASVGLADFGRPDGFLERQVRRWRMQLDASRSRELPELDELHGLLAGSVPATGRHSIVHGDYRLDNTIVDDEDRIAAVVDWEMATLGDPLADLGLLCVYWDAYEEVPHSPLQGGITREAGFPAAHELVDRYAVRSGADLADWPWYLAFGHFKLAVIAEGIHYRDLQGKTVGAGFDRMGDAVLPLARYGLTALTATP